MAPKSEEWQVKRETAPGSGRFNTLFSGDEFSAREYVINNFPRPHVELGQDEPRADVQLHGPDGQRHEFHGVGAGTLQSMMAAGGDHGWVDLNATEQDDEQDAAAPEFGGTKDDNEDEEVQQ